MVETSSDWIVEAVWDGDFSEGDFDKTDLVFGTGIRVRDDQLIFVSAGTVFDRLWHVRVNNTWHVSNSLPGLLAVTNLQLKSDYFEYARDIRSITRGLERRVATIPTETADVHSVYFKNIRFEDGRIVEVAKPDVAPDFEDYQTYKQFLFDTAESIGENMRDSARRHPIKSLTSLSSGYDSSATAVVAQHAGCNQAVTFRDSASFWRGSDSGAPVAEALGMTCKEYSREANDYSSEESVWAATAWPGTLNWTSFDYPNPLCLFFTGCHGEKMWDRIQHDDADPFVRRDVSSLGFCEFRLLRGVWQCVVPFWGIRRSHQMRDISNSKDLSFWATGKDYDKPIARRLVEESGVPRKAFGQLKRNAVLVSSFFWPYSSNARIRFRRYLKSIGVYAPSQFVVRCVSFLSLADNLFYRNTLKRLGIGRRPRPWHYLKAPYMLFQWANEEMKQQYAQGLQDMKACDSPPSKVSSG